MAEIGRVESAAGPEQPARPSIDAPRRRRRGGTTRASRASVSSGDDTGSWRRPRARRARAIERPCVERAITRDEHVHLHHRLEVNHVEGGAPRDGVLEHVARGDVVRRRCKAGGEGRRVCGAAARRSRRRRCSHAARRARSWRSSLRRSDGRRFARRVSRTGARATRRSGGHERRAVRYAPHVLGEARARSSAATKRRPISSGRGVRQRPGQTASREAHRRCGSARARAEGAAAGRRLRSSSRWTRSASGSVSLSPRSTQAF